MVYTPQTWTNGEAGGTPLSAARLQVMEDGIAGVGGGWTAYVPTWSNLTIGNAVVSTRYMQFGKTVIYCGQMSWGSTTSASGIWIPSLPVANAGGNTAGAAWVFDSSAVVWSPSTFVPGAYFIASTGRVNATVPWTWAVGDIVCWSVTYEVA